MSDAERPANWKPTAEDEWPLAPAQAKRMRETIRSQAAEIEALRADAERWRAYRSNVSFMVKMKGTTLHCGGHPFIDLDEYGPAADAAIDAARKG